MAVGAPGSICPYSGDLATPGITLSPARKAGLTGLASAANSDARLSISGFQVWLCPKTGVAPVPMSPTNVAARLTIPRRPALESKLVFPSASRLIGRIAPEYGSPFGVSGTAVHPIGTPRGRGGA